MKLQEVTGSIPVEALFGSTHIKLFLLETIETARVLARDRKGYSDTYI